MSFLGSLRISAKITLANILLLSLLLMVGVTSVLSLRQSLGTFGEYKSLTDQANDAAEILEHMLGAEKAVRDYVLNPGEETQNLVLTRIDQTKAAIDQVRGQTLSSAMITQIDQAEQTLQAFSGVFTQVTEKQQERDKLINVDLSKIGNDIGTNLFALMDTISLDDDALVTFLAGETMKEFMDARSLAQQFLFLNDEESFAKATKKLGSYTKKLNELEGELKKKHKANWNKAVRDTKKYQPLLEKAREVIGARNSLDQFRSRQCQSGAGKCDQGAERRCIGAAGWPWQKGGRCCDLCHAECDHCCCDQCSVGDWPGLYSQPGHCDPHRENDPRHDRPGERGS